MEMKFCQSCAVPLNDENMGTEADGSVSEDYCIYCYKEGKFTREMTMEQMIDFCAQFTDEINRQSGKNLTVEQARMMMRQFFPQLKRWKQSNHVNQ
ncbi:MAG: zinc ribbon domain-containing protein [Muribaculaceae bacterium]|nr:zinc ribbon domain-containing protein [Muribaculaceae bacterium]